MTSIERKLKQPFGTMTNFMFDTHKYIKFLKSKGIKEAQAESIVQVVSESRDMDMSRVSTREQVENVKEQVEGLKERIDKIDNRLDRIEQEMKTSNRWIIGLILAVLTLMATILLKR